MTIRQRRGGNHTDNNANSNTTVSAENNEAWNVLADAGFFFIKQRVDWEEALTGIEVANQYFVFDERNVQQYEVVEHQSGCMDCLTRQFLKNQRPFTLFVSHKQKRWIKIVRNYTCWLQRIQIYEDSDNCPKDVIDDNVLLGSVVQKWTFLSRSFYSRLITLFLTLCNQTRFSNKSSLIFIFHLYIIIIHITKVLDDKDEVVLEISTSFFNPYNFKIFHEGVEVGEIKKEWSGLGQELFTDADNFGFNMDKNLTELQKALLLSAVFLIDFMYFEDNEPTQNRNRRNGGFNSYAF
jgi:hypothetical protein